MKKPFRLVASALLAAIATGAQAQPQANAPKEATETTRAANQAYLATLPMADKQSFDDARRGLVESLGGDQVITSAQGRPAWSLKGYEFLSKEQAPDTVNPALWRHARVNMGAGLYKVTDGIYQLRGFDLSNMTVIEGKTGLILVDPLITTETAKAALELYYKHRPRKPVAAVIYSHSHVDHFGGVRGVVNEEDVASGKVKIIAPVGFMEEAVSENVIAGNAMSRRGIYQFGPLLPRGEKGQVDAGLGKSVSSGTISLIPPTMLIEKPTEAHTIDGVDIVFELTPGAEAPSEMIMYYPQSRVLNMTEIAAQTMHNLLPMRGALVRDPLIWSKHLGGALQRYAAKSDVMIMQHNWPVWGADRVQGFLAKQRDAYKYVHDQTVRLMNHGHVGSEIADTLKMPASLSQDWSTHAFYGDLKHNIKAIYQRYLGYYDGNPANLYALPPVPAAQKTIEYMGGAAAVLQRARADFAKGEFRWVAQMASQLVFADPANLEARGLAADAYEQLGYQAESSTARNALLQGASELRNGLPKMPALNTQAPDVIRALTLDMFFDYLAVRLNGDKAAGKATVLNWQFTDTKQNYVLNLENSALTFVSGAQSAKADATLVLTRATLDEISLQKTTFPAALQAGQIVVTGKREKVGELLGMLDTFPTTFPLIEPRPAH
ncbi:alkyl/aryl-sulfatase [Variovorax paradoxus]|uniref:alkyl/aryl-sulfatase n=1 Tax=Variovorax paradoxus TaxID=34073 RepID=UPI003D650BAF